MTFKKLTDSQKKLLERRFVIDMIPGGAICAELGVWQGDFSEAVATLAKPREYYLIDPWAFVPSFPMRWYGGALASSQKDMDDIHQSVVTRMEKFHGVSIRRQPSLDAVASFPDRYFDWVYVDGDHSYQAAKDDLKAWFSKVKPRGLLVVDDYNWKDEAGTYSVRRAIEEFVQEFRLRAPLIRDDQCILTAQ